MVGGFARRLALLVAVALAVAPATAPLAFGQNDTVTLDEVSITGDTYAAWRVHVPEGATIAPEGQSPFGGDLAAFSGSGYVFFPDGELETGATVTYFSGSQTTVHAQVDASEAPGAPLPEVHAEDGGGFAFPPLGGTVYTSPSDQDLIAVAFAAADHEFDGTLRLRGSPSVTVEDRVMGDAFLLQDTGFSGDENAILRMHTPHNLHVRHIENAQTTQRIDHRLFALYQGFSNDGDLQMGYEGPGGSHDGATFYTAFDGPPGEYTFRIDHTDDVGLPGADCNPGVPCRPLYVWAVGADLDLPTTATAG